MQRWQKQIEELTKANEILQYENQGLKAKLDSGDSLPLLVMGDEDDFYQGSMYHAPSASLLNLRWKIFMSLKFLKFASYNTPFLKKSFNRPLTRP